MMFKIISIVTLLLFSQFLHAAEITKEDKVVIDEMLQITGAYKIAEMMGTAVSNQMITAMSQQHKDLDPRVKGIVQDEIGKIMHDEFIANGFLKETSYRIYHKYFTTAELKEIVAFYKTPTGKKLTTLLPKITQEGMLAGQQHGQSLGPVIRQRLMARFEKEGIK